MAFQIPELMPHQQMARDFIVSRPHCGVFLGIGGAKTLSTLAALAQVRPAGHILVVAPLAIARSTWIDEIEKWLKFVALHYQVRLLAGTFANFPFIVHNK